ncbi:MAG: hypothetical protein IT245_02440, partial [Bacteroidia bacterium]|nr:hypothetical protein [Bacteroidia bacterium]
GKWSKGSCRLFLNIKKGFKFFSNGINGFVGVEDVANAMTRFGLGSLKNKRFLMVSENMSYKDLFNLMAKSMDVNPPKYEIKRAYLPWLKFPIWLMSKLNSSSSLSVETLKTSLKKHSYNNAAIKKEGFEFEPIESVIANTAKFLN